MTVLYLNDSYVDETEAVISAGDRGFLYGEGLFETLAAYKGNIFRLERHLKRLWESALALDISLPLSQEEAGGILKSLIEKNGLSDAYLRINVSSGPADGMVPGLKGDPTVLAVARSLTRYPRELYEKGAGIVTTPYYLGPLSHHKTLSFFPNVRARTEAVQRGADEALLLDRNGNPAECSASNLFLVKDGAAATPPLESGILPGITRAEVIDIGTAEGNPVAQRLISLDELRTADEIFITNTIMGIMPVGTFDGIALPAQRPVTERLAECYTTRICS